MKVTKIKPEKIFAMLGYAGLGVGAMYGAITFVLYLTAAYSGYDLGIRGGKVYRGSKL